MAQFDIYIAKVYYSETDPRYEFKPVVQIKSNAKSKDSFAVITHVDPREGWPGEIPIENYTDCGLHKKSTIRITQRLDEPIKKKYVGTLTNDLAAKVVYAMHVKHRIQRHKTEEFDDEFTINSILNEVLDD